MDKKGEKGRLINLGDKRREKKLPDAEVSQEIIDSNKENAERIMEERAEENRKKLLEGIDSELIKTTQEKARWILDQINVDDQTMGQKKIDALIRSHHPKHMMSIIHGVISRKMIDTNPAEYAAIAFAFLGLTKERD